MRATDVGPLQRKILTMPEVSAMTGVPINTLRYWRHLGTGPKGFKLGRRVVYDLAAVSAWIDAQRGAGEPRETA